MDEGLARFAIVVLPILGALIEVAFGSLQAWLGLRRRRFRRLAWGGSLAVAGVACLGATLVYYLDRRHSGGFALIWVLAAWLLPAALIPAATVVLASVVTLLGSLRRNALAARGFVQLPAAPATWAAASALLVALATFANFVAVPAWQLWPYGELAASGYTDSITLMGIPASGEDRQWVPICMIRWEEASPWRARFDLDLDPGGRVVVTTYRWGDERLSRREQLLPFEDSEYFLRDGVLERTR